MRFSVERYWALGATPATESAATAPAKLADATTLDEKGYIHNWLLLGPITFGDQYNADDIAKEQIPKEAAMMPSEGEKLKVKMREPTGDTFKDAEKELVWTRVKTPDYFLDFNDIYKLDASEATGAYAVAYLDAPEKMAVTLSLCSNDNGKIYLNGKSVYEFVGGRALAEDADTVDVTLNKGLNVLIFKVWNDANDWQACIRLLDKNQKPIQSVKVR